MLERNTIIEDTLQISCRRARPNPLTDRHMVSSPMSDDFPTPRAYQISARINSDQTSGPSLEVTSDRGATYDELYDISESESEEVQIKLSSSVKRRMNRQERLDRYPSLVIPSPSQWPTIEKLRSATALSPPITVDIPSSALKKLEERSSRVPSSSSAPSLDGSASGDDSASLSSCPPTPDLAIRDEENDKWDVPIQLDPSSLSLLRQLGSHEASQTLETVLEVSEEAEAVGEMTEVRGSQLIPVTIRLDTTNLPPVNTVPCEDDLSALSVPSPGGFFASLNSVTQRTWTWPDAAPSTSVAAEFYDLPFRAERPSSLPTSTATQFYDLPWSERSATVVEHVISVPSPTAKDDPITAKKGVFSPTELVNEVDEIDEHYDDTLKEKTAASFDRTALWITAQDEYMKAICDEDEADVTETFKDVVDAVPRTPEDPVPQPLDRNSPGKKSVRFADSVVESVKPAAPSGEKQKRISPIHDGTFWEGWRHTKRSQRARDVFQHRQLRAETEHVRRTSCQSQHADQLKGKFTITATLRPAPTRPISFLPDGTEDEEEKKEALQQLERERQALDQIATSTWHLAAHRQINGGKLITSPVTSSFSTSTSQTRILDLHGQIHCSWAWNVAMEHKEATIYTMATSDAEAHVMESMLEGPENHIVTVAPKAWELPFGDNFFDVISARNLYAHLRTVWPKGHAADEWDLTLRECMRVLKPGGYLEFHLLDAELIHPDASAQALGVEFAFNLKTRGYDPISGRTFLPRLKRAGFTDIKRAWMVLPAADVVPRWVDNGKVSAAAEFGSPGGDSAHSIKPSPVLSVAEQCGNATASVASPEGEQANVMGSTKDVRAITGLVGARMWEQWMLKLNCEMGRSEKRCLEGVSKALEESGKSNAAWRCLVGWARKGM